MLMNLSLDNLCVACELLMMFQRTLQPENTQFSAECWVVKTFGKPSQALQTYVDHGVLRRSVGPLHSSFHLDLLPGFPLLSHHQLSDRYTCTVSKEVIVGWQHVLLCVWITPQFKGVVLCLRLTCGSSTAPCRCQNRGRPCPRPPRSPGRTAALSTWSGSGRYSSGPHWKTQQSEGKIHFNSSWFQVWFDSLQKRVVVHLQGNVLQAERLQILWIASSWNKILWTLILILKKLYFDWLVTYDAVLWFFLKKGTPIKTFFSSNKWSCHFRAQTCGWGCGGSSATPSWFQSGGISPPAVRTWGPCSSSWRSCPPLHRRSRWEAARPCRSSSGSFWTSPGNEAQARGETEDEG